MACATVAALKRQRALGRRQAPAFSYAQVAVDTGVTVASVTTLNTPHLGSPAYDLARDLAEGAAPPAEVAAEVAAAWGAQFAELAASLAPSVPHDAGSMRILETSAHSGDDPDSWDQQQVDGVAFTMLGGDVCGDVCGDAGPPPRTDGTVPLYSQLILPCPAPCGPPPASVFVPPGMVPAGAVRKIFPTVHSTFITKQLGLPGTLSVSADPTAVAYLVRSTLARWRAAGARLLPRA